MAEIMYVDWDGLVYYDTRSKQYIKDIVDQTIKFGGQYIFEDVPAPGFETLHVAYKITDKFVVSPETAYFLKSCAGKAFEGGTVILVVEDGESDTYRFDILFEAYSGVPLTPGGEIDLSNYYTKAQVNDLLSGKVEVEELGNYYLKTETDNKLADKADKSDIDGLATEEFVATALQALEIPEVPTKVSELENDLGYITEHQDISGKADKTELENFVTKSDFDVVQQQSAQNEVKIMMLDEEIVDINQRIDAIPKVDLTGYATEEFVAAAINAIQIPDDYLTEEDLQNKDFATKDDLTAYAKDYDLNTVSLNVEEIEKTVSKNTKDIETLDEAVSDNAGSIDALRGEVTEVSEKVTDLQEAVNNIVIPKIPTRVSELENDAGYLTEHQDISHLANKSEVEAVRQKAAANEVKILGLDGEVLGLKATVEGLTIPTKTSELTNDSGFITAADIPEVDLTDYYNKSEVDQKFAEIEHPTVDLDGYATETWVNEQGFLKEHQDLSEYAKKSEVPSIEGLATEDFVKGEIAKADLNGGEVTEEELNNLLANYYNKSEVDALIPEVSELATRDEVAAVEAKVDAVVIPEVPTKVSELENDAGYLTAHQDLSEYAKKSEIPSVDGLASEEFVLKKIAEAELADQDVDLSAYYTKSEVDALIEIPEEYVTEDELTAKGYLTAHQSLEGYAKLTDIPDVSNFAGKDEIPSVEGLASETYVDEKFAEITIPEVPTKVSELENDAEYTTESWVVNKIDSWVGALETQVTQHYASKDELADLNTNVTNQMAAKADVIHVHKVADITDLDLSCYYDKSETETLVNEAVNGITIPDTSNFITMQDVEDKGYLTEHQDISGKADVDHKHTLADIEDYVPVDFEPYALKTDIPSIEGLATETFVKNAIAEAELGDKEVDLTGYATKDELSAVEAKIPSIEGLATETFVTESINNIQPTDLSNYYNKTETENLVDDAVKAIIVPEVPTNVSAFTNDANYTTLAEVATQGYLTSIPDEYVTADELAQEGFLKEHQSLEGYVKDAELTDAIEAVEHKIVTKTSELENDAEFVTASTLPAFVKPDDITDFVTLTEVEEAGFIKSIPDEYVTEIELADQQFVTEESLSQRGFITDISDKADKDHIHSYNDLTDLPTIPSIEGLATKDYIDDAVANIDIPAVDTTNLLTKDEATTLLTTKANDVPFADDYRVGTALGGFVVDESLQGMTVVQILTKLLNLNLYVPPVADIPEGTPEQAVEIITKGAPVYIIGESGEQVEIPYYYITMTPEEAVKDNQSDSYFYQIIDPETGEAVESGYQIVTIYQENDYLTVYLPEIITKFHVEEYSALAGDWSQPTWELIENPEHKLEGYVAYTADPAYEVYSGIAVRVIIDE